MKKIKQFFNWVAEQKNKALNKFDGLDIEEAIEFAGNIRRFVKSDIVQTIVTVSPTSVDNAVRNQIDEIMEEIIDMLNLAQKCQASNYPNKLRCLVDELKTYHPEAQKGMYTRIAAWFLKRKLISQGRSVKVTDCIIAVQAKFEQLYPS